MSYKETCMGIALSLATTILAIAGVELALRLLDEPKWDTPIIAGWRSVAPSAELNDFGYRGQPIRYDDRDFVVIMLGDSQVESAACPQNMTPEHLLEKALLASGQTAKVFTLGTAGYGTDQEYLALKNYFAGHRADLVLLWQTSTNDIWNNVFPTHIPKDGVIKPTFVVRDGKLAGPNYQLGEVIRRPAHTKIGVLVNRLLNPQRGLDAYWERFLPPAYQPLDRYDGPYVTDWDPANPSNKNPFLANENLETEKSHFAIALYPPSQRMSYGLDLTRLLTREVETLSKEHGADFALFTVVTPEAAHGEASLAHGAADSADHAAGQIVHKKDGKFYRTSTDQERANLVYVNKGFTYIPVPIKQENWRVSETDGHLNCTANEEAMRNLAQSIAPYLDKSARK